MLCAGSTINSEAVQCIDRARLRDGDSERETTRPHSSGRQPPALPALHVRHDGQPKGHRAHQRGSPGRAQLFYAAHLRHASDGKYSEYFYSE